MNKKLIPVFLCGILFAACPGHKEQTGRQAKGGVYYGGTFRINEITNFRSLYPLDVTELVAVNITNQIFEGLVKLSPKDLTVVPALAERWIKNDSAVIWTFYIRKGVHFQDDPCFEGGKGREITANDFKWCFDQLCTA